MLNKHLLLKLFLIDSANITMPVPEPQRVAAFLFCTIKHRERILSRIIMPAGAASE
jgi:hypothetical protein